MASVKLLEFEQLVEEKETRLDFQVTEFLSEKKSAHSSDRISYKDSRKYNAIHR